MTVCEPKICSNCSKVVDHCGEKGDEGAQGEKGPRGVTGVQGIQGAQGIQGINGVSGINGVPGPNGLIVSGQSMQVSINGSGSIFPSGGSTMALSLGTIVQPTPNLWTLAGGNFAAIVPSNGWYMLSYKIVVTSSAAANVTVGLRDWSSGSVLSSPVLSSRVANISPTPSTINGSVLANLTIGHKTLITLNATGISLPSLTGYLTAIRVY